MLCFGLISDRSQNLLCTGKYVEIFTGSQPVDLECFLLGSKACMPFLTCISGTIGVASQSAEADYNGSDYIGVFNTLINAFIFYFES